MTKERMIDLLEALQQHGWELTNLAEMFTFEAESIHWNLEHPQANVEVELVFYVCTAFGEPSDSLKDIGGCYVEGYDIKLFFEKRKPPKWPQAMREFVFALQSLCTRISDEAKHLKE